MRKPVSIYDTGIFICKLRREEVNGFGEENLSHRQRKPESVDSVFRDDADFALMPVDDFFDDGKAESVSAGFTASGCVQPVQPLEYAVLFGVRDFRSRAFD